MGLGFGLLSAASLPLGAALGLLFSPVPPRFVALCMAFGSGALAYAVATDLFGEALHRLQEVQDKSSDEFMLMWCSIFVNTGLLAMLGWIMMPGKVVDFSPTDMAMNILTGVMQGITGGATMAMTSTAMLPEAFHGAGNLSGMLFVTGFLVSVSVKGLDVCF